MDTQKPFKEELPPMPSVAEHVQTFTTIKETPVAPEQPAPANLVIPQAFTGPSAMDKLLQSAPGAAPPLEPIKLPGEDQPVEPEEVEADADQQDRVLTPTMIRKQEMRRKAEERRAATMGESSTDIDSDFEKLVEINWKYQMTTKQEEELGDFTRSMDVPEDDGAQASHRDKIALFKKFEKEAMDAGVQLPMTPKSQRKFLDRRKRFERSKTQPVTEEEVHLAAEFAKDQRAQHRQQQQPLAGAEGLKGRYPMIRPQPEVVNRARLEGRAEEETTKSEGEEDELSKYALIFLTEFLE